MTIWMIVGISVVGAVLALTLRQTQPAFATALGIVVGVLLFAASLAAATPAVQTITMLLSRSSIGGLYGPVLIKALGISLLTQTAADVCRDAGESTIAGKVELGGKVLLLLCALPLFEYTVSLLDSIISGQAVMP